MKTVIIGKRGIGVTYFIKNTLLKEIDKALICDLNEEYKQLEKYRVFPLHFKINEMNEKVAGMIVIADKNETIVLDSFKSYLSPKMDSKNKTSYEWLNNILKDRKSILTLQSVEDIDKIGIDEIEKIYLFDTIDSDNSVEVFIEKYANIIERVPIFTRNGE